MTSGVQTAAMVTGMAAAGGAQGIMQGRAAGGGFGSLSKLGILMGSGMAGMGHGLGSSMSGVAKGSGFGGTSMAGDMGGMGKSMEKEFGGKESVGQMRGITGFLKHHLGGGPADGAKAATDTAGKDGAASGGGDSNTGGDSSDGGQGGDSDGFSGDSGD